MIKAIFFDIDGTLLMPYTGELLETTRKALYDLQEKGIKIFICSGRHLREIEEQPIYDIHFDGYICLTGQLGLNENYEVIFDHPIESMDYLKYLFNENIYPIVFIEKERLYLNYCDGYVEKAQEMVASAVPEISTYQGDLVYQAVAYVDQEQAKEIQIPGCRITRWNPYGIDIISKVGGKAKGILEMLDYFDIDISETMAFGDGENDIDMLKLVQIGVAMPWADEHVKKSADYIADLDIYSVLKHYNIL